MNDSQKEKARSLIERFQTELESSELYPYGAPEIHKTIKEAVELLSELSADPDYTGCYD